jgi:hypothetical protein
MAIGACKFQTKIETERSEDSLTEQWMLNWVYSFKLYHVTIMD